MIKVLVNAYACSPNMGSEPGMAWNWCVNLAKHCELFIITEGEFRDKIEIVLPTLPQGGNMHFYYNPVPDFVRKMCWNQGDWRFYWYYHQWQKRTLAIAKAICDEHEIDIIHQLNMIGFREPGLLWKIKEKPFVWGPTNAKEAFPIAYLQGVSLKSKIFIYLKNAITKYQLSKSGYVRKAAKRASLVIAASSDSAKSIQKYWDTTPIIINESGCEVECVECEKEGGGDVFNLLWVGRFIFTKQLSLALLSLVIIKNEKIKLHIVGGTDEEERVFKLKARELGIEHLCVWHGRVAHDTVQVLMQNSDLFFFTSIAEGTPHVILEAFNNNLPVLCFDTCGQGDCVNEKVGIKIPLSNPVRSINDFAEKIDYLYHHREVLRQMSNNCKKRAEELSWENKAKQMIALYEEILNRN